MMSQFFQEPARTERRGGVLALAAGIAAAGVASFVVAGPLAAAIFGGLPAVALGTTLLAGRNEEAMSRDAMTGIPDRAAALDRLRNVISNGSAPPRPAALIVVRLGAEPQSIDRRSLTLLAALRLTQALRHGDQIFCIGPTTVAAFLGPARSLDAVAVATILERVAQAFAEPFRIGEAFVETRAAIGACIQHDAPEPTADAWMEAAELAARLAVDADVPVLFEPGLTPAAAADHRSSGEWAAGALSA